MTNSKHILVCSDFDGTMTLQDTGVLLIDRCMGAEKRKELDSKVLRGELDLRTAFKMMWDSVDLSMDEAQKIYDEVQLDEKFKSFAEFCFSEEITFVVISGGLQFVIENFLKVFFPEEHKKFRIESNYGSIENNKWTIDFHDDSPFGHDKGKTIKEIQAEYVQNHEGKIPYTIFCGDGVSDLSAANHADILFARKNSDLEKYCLKHSIPFEPFENFQVVLDAVKLLYK